MSIDRLTTNPSWGFSDAVTTSGGGQTIYISGMVGFGDDGKVVSGGMEAEARATFANIEKTLQTGQCVKLKAGTEATIEAGSH